MMNPFSWRETNKMIWRTDVGLTQKVVNKSKVKIVTLSWSGYKTHRRRPVDDVGMTVTFGWTSLEQMTRHIGSIDSLEKLQAQIQEGDDPRNQWIYPIPVTSVRGVSCSRVTAAQTTFIVYFPITPTIWMSTPFLFYELEGDNRCSIWAHPLDESS